MKLKDMDMESITISHSFQTDQSREKFTKTEMESTLEIGFWSGNGVFLKIMHSAYLVYGKIAC